MKPKSGVEEKLSENPVIVALILAAVVFSFLFVLGLGVAFPGAGDKHYCTPDQRGATVFPALYHPVCAWFDPKIVQCIRYPCAQNEDNEFAACANPNVLYWTEGGCPK
jgi:hypothetical protein